MSKEWNRHALLHPLVRRFLDVTFKMPGSMGRKGRTVVDDLMIEVEGLVRRACLRGMDVGGYDRDAADAVALALGRIIDAKCQGSMTHDDVYERVLSGTIVLVECCAAARHGRRYGSVLRLSSRRAHGGHSRLRRRAYHFGRRHQMLSLAKRRLGFAERLARLIPDRRDPTRITHSVADMIRARALTICRGYENADDLDTYALIRPSSLPDTGVDLCSQPNLSRLENAPRLRGMIRLTSARRNSHARGVTRRHRDQLTPH